MYMKLISELRKQAERKSLSTYTRDLMREAANVIADYDIAELKPVVRGKWIRKLDTRFGPKLNDIIICSNCNIAFSTEDLIRRSFCPSCGAEMWGVDNDKW